VGARYGCRSSDCSKRCARASFRQTRPATFVSVRETTSAPTIAPRRASMAEGEGLQLAEGGCGAGRSQTSACRPAHSSR
jgi:hypothetical protein